MFDTSKNMQRQHKNPPNVSVQRIKAQNATALITHHHVTNGKIFIDFIFLFFLEDF